MNIKDEFQNKLKDLSVKSKHLLVKPNWVSNVNGEFTESEILDWVLEVFPDQKKYIVESYTPWRGLNYLGEHKDDDLVVNLDGGKKYWEFYKRQDKEFLKNTGISQVLKKYSAKYINVTNEYWANKCVDSNIISQEVNIDFEWKELTSCIPEELFNVKDDSTFISLAKIKLEPSIPQIKVSMSIKNLFGLIPHPSRWNPFHENNHKKIPQAICDIYNIYDSLFTQSIWINEGIFSLVQNYCENDQFLETNRNLFFIDDNGYETDSATCTSFGIDPTAVPYLELIKNSSK